jgi:hypothetical protein
MKLLGLLTLATLLAACGGRTPLDELAWRSKGGSTGSPDGDLGNPTATGGGPGASDAGAGACYGRCSTPPGAIALDPSIGPAILGIWEICSGGHDLFTGSPSDTIGVEFTPPGPGGNTGLLGDLYFLKRGPSGPVRGEGSAYHHTYEVIGNSDISCRSQGDTIWYDFSLRYSPCPREWWLQNSPHSNEGTLASF